MYVKLYSNHIGLKTTLLILSFFTSNLFAIRLADEVPSGIEALAEEMNQLPTLFTTILSSQRGDEGEPPGP